MAESKTHPTSTRHKARKRAVEVAYSADLMERPLLKEFARLNEAAENPPRLYTQELIYGLAEHLPEVDEALETALEPSGWTLPRLSHLDKAIARVACYEIKFGHLAKPVAISQAVRLADELSSDNSAAFLNGVLAAIQ
ncbi:MAG: transcription antitermination protein NusB [Propionibacteriaceae bacterium]|nr:transcription antitermination protein NusB [Propionibacteriaceae bacterium]